MEMTLCIDNLEYSDPNNTSKTVRNQNLSKNNTNKKS